MKSSQGKTKDVNICFINYEMIKTHIHRFFLNEWVSSVLFIIFRDCIILRCVRFFLIFYLNHQQRVTRSGIRIDKWEEITK